ncbi:MAG: ABC transporter permease [Oscillospiraceae bacterium]|nr:ABC transporter permease [Oscillospiraceae bacterium]
MFWNIYSKRVLYSLRSRDILIWTWIFPVMLATLFFATMSSIDESGQLSEISLGIVDNMSFREDPYLYSTLESIEGDNDDKLFTLTIIDNVPEADRILTDGVVDGYILFQPDPKLIVVEDGLNQTIIRSVLEHYQHTKNAVNDMLLMNNGDYEIVSSALQNINYTEEISLAGNPPTDKVNYYYALLAMICMYGSFQGLTSVTLLQANLSPLGARTTMSPVKRFKMILFDLFGGITVHFCCTLFSVAYIIFVLKINFGNKLWLVLLTCFIGCLLGVSFGSVISVMSKLKEQAKIAILICVSMVCSFLSGLMVTGINYTVMQEAPLVAWLNPAARITDAFYCLYYYDSYDRYLINIGIILIMVVVMFAITSVFIRRQRYESI